MGSPVFLIWIVLIGAMFYFMMIRPQKRARAQQSDLLQHLQPGAQVRTTAQIMGTVVEVGDDWAIVETTPGTRIKFGKPAIVGVILDDEEGTEGAEAGESGEAAEDAPTPGGIGDAPAGEKPSADAKPSVQDAVPAQAQDATPAEADAVAAHAGTDSDTAADADEAVEAADKEPAGEVKDAEPAKS